LGDFGKPVLKLRDQFLRDKHLGPLRRMKLNCCAAHDAKQQRIASAEHQWPPQPGQVIRRGADERADTQRSGPVDAADLTFRARLMRRDQQLASLKAASLAADAIILPPPRDVANCCPAGAGTGLLTMAQIRKDDDVS
jgi:hypothetical protein